MERMPGATSHSWRFIDEHSMDGLDIRPAETFQVRNQVGVSAVALKYLIKLKILNFSDVGFSYKIQAVFILLNEGDVFDYLHAWQSN